jgi:L-lactate utilization protein LutC
MKTKNENLPIEGDAVESQHDKTGKSKKPGKIGTLILNHKMVFSLLFALIVVFLWAIIKMKIMENRFEKQTTELKKEYESKIDSLTTKQLDLTSRVFSWAVRSELTRENKEQVNQFFLSFIKEPGIKKVEYVDAANSRVILSTDKKDEGTVYSNQVAVMTDETIHFTNDSILNVITPVMGLNSKLGILVIEYIAKY